MGEMQIECSSPSYLFCVVLYFWKFRGSDTQNYNIFLELLTLLKKQDYSLMPTLYMLLALFISKELMLSFLYSWLFNLFTESLKTFYYYSSADSE